MSKKKYLEVCEVEACETMTLQLHNTTADTVFKDALGLAVIWDYPKSDVKKLKQAYKIFKKIKKQAKEDG